MEFTEEQLSQWLAGFFWPLTRIAAMLMAAPIFSIRQIPVRFRMLLAAPILLASLAVGLIIAMFQAATQINEMTLSFIPKLLAMLAALVISAPWMLALLVDYTRRLLESLAMLPG